MQKFGSGILLLAAALLLILSVRTLGQVQGLQEKIEILERSVRTKPAVTMPSSPAPLSQDRPASQAPAEPTAAATVSPSSESSPAATVRIDSTAVRVVRQAKPATLDRLGGGIDLSPEQKRTLEGILESQRRELLQVEGDTALRRLELERRYDALIRAWLNPDQQRAFDESRRAAAPRPDGPVTSQAQSYLRQDPAPYDLEVEWGGEWWPARTREIRGELTLIHYVGHGDEWHEWVGSERMRPRR